jgi:hypothetical protein
MQRKEQKNEHVLFNSTKINATGLDGRDSFHFNKGERAFRVKSITLLMWTSNTKNKFSGLLRQSSLCLVFAVKNGEFLANMLNNFQHA